MATTEQYIFGTETTLINNTAFSALANNAAVLSTAYDNTQPGTAGKGYVFCRLKLMLTMAVAASPNTSFTLWWVRSTDGGATYDSSTATFMATQASFLSVGAPTDTVQLQTTRDVQMPAGFFKILVKNDGTGQATKTDVTAAGSILTITPFTRQSV